MLAKIKVYGQRSVGPPKFGTNFSPLTYDHKILNKRIRLITHNIIYNLLNNITIFKLQIICFSPHLTHNDDTFPPSTFASNSSELPPMMTSTQWSSTKWKEAFNTEA